MNCPSTDMKSCVSDAQTHVQACKEREEGVNKRKKRKIQPPWDVFMLRRLHEAQQTPHLISLQHHLYSSTKVNTRSTYLEHERD